MQLSPSTPSQPQALKIGETFRKSAIKRHEEKIQGIQCYLKEIPPERFEQIENGIEGLGKGTIIIQRDFDALAAELQQAHTQITKPRRKKIGSNHKISLARYRIVELAEVINDMETQAQAATMASASNPNRNTGPTGTPAVKTGNYKEFISCQPFYFNGTEGAVVTTKESLMTEELSTTAPAATTTTATPTIVTIIIDNRTEGKKLVEPVLLLHQEKVGMPEISLCVKGAITITADPVLWFAMPVVRKDTTQISAKRPTLMPKEEPTCWRSESQQDPQTSLHEKRLKDIFVVKEFPDVFPEDLPGIPPVRQVEFQIDLIPITLYSSTPSRLAPSDNAGVIYHFKN
ncbi:hypothetical protein Tco_0640064 [Tanacetum coccineum]